MIGNNNEEYQNIAKELGIEGKTIDEIVDFLISSNDGKEKIEAYIEKYNDDILDIKEESDQLKEKYIKDLEEIDEKQRTANREKNNQAIRHNNAIEIIEKLKNGENIEEVKVEYNSEIETKKIILENIEKQLEQISKKSELLNGNISNRSLRKKDELEEQKEELVKEIEEKNQEIVSMPMTEEDYISIKEESFRLYKDYKSLIEKYQVERIKIVDNYTKNREEKNQKYKELLHEKAIYIDILSKINNKLENKDSLEKINPVLIDNNEDESISNLLEIIDDNSEEKNIEEQKEESVLNSVENKIVPEEEMHEIFAEDEPVYSGNNIFKFEKNESELEDDQKGTEDTIKNEESELQEINLDEKSNMALESESEEKIEIDDSNNELEPEEKIEIEESIKEPELVEESNTAQEPEFEINSVDLEESPKKIEVEQKDEEEMHEIFDDDASLNQGEINKISNIEQSSSNETTDYDNFEEIIDEAQALKQSNNDEGDKKEHKSFRERRKEKKEKKKELKEKKKHSNENTAEIKEENVEDVVQEQPTIENTEEIIKDNTETSTDKKIEEPVIDITEPSESSKTEEPVKEEKQSDIPEIFKSTPSSQQQPVSNVEEFTIERVDNTKETLYPELAKMYEETRYGKKEEIVQKTM